MNFSYIKKCITMGKNAAREWEKNTLKPYDKWIKYVENGMWYKGKLEINPLISVVVPVYNTEEGQLRACIDSILSQTYDNFEIILVDDCSTWEIDRIILKEYEKNEHIKVIYRDKNGHISEATNTGLKVAKGEYVAFVDCDDVISSHALYEIVHLIEKNPDYDIVYSDEDRISEDGSQRYNPFFKPDWSPDTLMSFMYMNHLTVYRREKIELVGGLRTKYNGSQDYDLLLRVVEHVENKNIGHVPKVLYHWRERKESVSVNPDAKPYAYAVLEGIKKETLARRKIKGRLEYIEELHQYRIVYDAPENAIVSIIIPSKNNWGLLSQCVKSIKKNTNVPYEIIIVDNGSDEEVKKEIENYANSENIKYIYNKMDFNFASMCNMGASESTGNYLLFLNDDIEILDGEWLSRMLGHAAQTHVGAVGAKLIYPQKNCIQHIGVSNIDIGPVHSFYQFDDSQILYFLRNRVEYDWLAVTGACLLIKKEKYQEVDGFDESFPVAYNDVDLCFKLHEAGYFNVVRNDVQLIHHESMSRGLDSEDKEKTRRLISEKEKLFNKHPKLEKRDPYYNVNLSQESMDFELKYDIEKIQNISEAENINCLKELKGQVVIDVAIWQKNIVIKGWYYTGRAKQDNDSRVNILLKGKNEKCYMAKADKVLRPDVMKHLGNFACYIGFEAIMSVDKIKDNSSFQIGLVLKRKNKKSYVIWSDRILKNEG